MILNTYYKRTTITINFGPEILIDKTLKDRIHQRMKTYMKVATTKTMKDRLPIFTIRMMKNSNFKKDQRR